MHSAVTPGDAPEYFAALSSTSAAIYGRGAKTFREQMMKAVFSGTRRRRTGLTTSMIYVQNNVRLRTANKTLRKPATLAGVNTCLVLVVVRSDNRSADLVGQHLAQSPFDALHRLANHLH